MAHIKPFRGIVYNPSKIKNLTKVVTPPYDVISPRLQDHFYGVSPYNIVKLILGKDKGGDTAVNNKYTRARRDMDKWLKDSVLVRNGKPSIYIYRQIYFHEGKKRARTGFLSLVRIEDPHTSRVLPHEYTLAKPKVDRLNLIKQVESNLSPIFSLYYDKDCFISKLLKNFVDKNTAIIDLKMEGVTHRVWRLFDIKMISAIKNAMRDKKIVIADGHHRYEVALTYRNLMRKRKGSNKNADYVMMYFTNLKEANNVTILSMHRLLKETGKLKIAVLKQKLDRYFDIKSFDGLDNMLKALAGDKLRPCFGIYIKNEKFLLISLKKKVKISEIIRSDRSKQWKMLGVTVLHNFIIKNLLSLKDHEDNIKYVRDPGHVVESVDSGSFNIAFFLNPTKAGQVREVAEKGDVMPQKSTYFYPKLLTGLVINKF